MADVPVSKTEPGSVIGVSVVESVDAADHAGRFHGWDLRIDQVSYGRFAGRLVMIRLGSLEIIRETISQALIKQGSASPNSLVFSLPLAASNEAHFNGRPLAFPNVLLSDGADLPPLLTPTQLDVVSIAIARKRLTSLLETLGERRAADLVAGHRQQIVASLDRPARYRHSSMVFVRSATGESTSICDRICPRASVRRRRRR